MSSQQHVLVTGGSGYIGSHTTVQLLNAGYKVTVVDSLVNSSPKSLERVRELVGEEKAKNLTFVEADLVDKPALEAALSSVGKIDSCIHFAGLKAVGESVKLPLLYYHNNLTGTFFLLEVLKNQGCSKIVFSSSMFLSALECEWMDRAEGETVRFFFEFLCEKKTIFLRTYTVFSYFPRYDGFRVFVLWCCCCFLCCVMCVCFSHRGFRES